MQFLLYRKHCLHQKDQSNDAVGEIIAFHSENYTKCVKKLFLHTFFSASHDKQQLQDFDAAICFAIFYSC
jgi:hypothetical protein